MSNRRSIIKGSRRMPEVQSEKDVTGYGLFNVYGKPVGLRCKDYAEINKMLDIAEVRDEICVAEIKEGYVTRIWKYEFGYGWLEGYNTKTAVVTNYAAICYDIKRCIEANFKNEPKPENLSTTYKNYIHGLEAYK